VLTGGPGAGKTAVLELLRRTLCSHVAIAPESASILFRGGFPREDGEMARCAAQRAIVHVQLELETLVGSRPGVRVVLCDRGTLDSLAYWPRSRREFFEELETNEAEQLARYDVVIHVAPPDAHNGYHRDGTRIETALEAAAIDERIVASWRDHPRRFSVPSLPDFLDKAARVIALIEAELPAECRTRACGAGLRRLGRHGVNWRKLERGPASQCRTSQLCLQRSSGT
jgi:predicted ATPase